MTTLPDPPTPLMGEVPCQRLRAGEERTEPLWVCFEPAYGPVKACLQIHAGWNGRTFTAGDRYTVLSVRWNGPICDVVLARDPEKLLTVPVGSDRSPTHQVGVMGSGGWCTCRGYTLQQHEPRRNCKHIAALAFVRDSGILSDERRTEHGSAITSGRATDEPRGTGEGREQAGGTPAAV